MSERKPCIRCGRPIDQYARTCPFCNWDQSEPVPPPEEAPTQPVYVPPAENRWRGKILGLVALVSLLIIAFVIGMLIHGFEPSEVKAQTKNAATATGTMPTTSARSHVTLVPVTDSDVPQSIEQPITSAPPQGPGQQPNDATALPADQYAAAAARAKAEREAAAKVKNVLLDPRSITGPAYQPSQRPSLRVQKQTASSETPLSGEPQLEGAPISVRRTAAYLEYKPLPRVSVDHDITARLNLTVNEDGRVTDVDVSEPIPDMPKLIAAIQNWRFKPATENGTPVTSQVAVDITFHAHE